MPAKVRVYDRETGQHLDRFGVVAKEIVESDPKRFSFEPGAVQSEPAPAPAPAPAPPPAAAPPAARKPKRPAKAKKPEGGE